MSTDAHAAAPHDLVIVRRRTGSDHSEHHGGIWKIAYADFMTAMMAFFLVMWLINATDQQTLTAVASYFNPVKLTDKVTNPKGLHDLSSGARGDQARPGESNSKEGAARGDPRAEAAGKVKGADEALLNDSYALLTKLAALATAQLSTEAMAQPLAIGAMGEAFRDPFEPEFRRLTQQLQPPAAAASETDVAAPAPAAETRASRLEPGPADAPVEDDPPRTADESAAGGKRQHATQSQDADLQLQADIREIGEVAAASGKAPHIEIRATPEGVLISLTDDLDFGMFGIASAEPRPELVATMERIARVLGRHPGRIVVRGHTDGRPFRSPSYDNWRLSASRAHVAYTLLTRGGIDERRFERIEGHADRSLKVADDPGAARNRRIEILLRRGQAL